MPDKAIALLESGLFERVGSEVNFFNLKLKDTRYFIIVRINGESSWWYFPPGTVFGPGPSPYTGRPSHAILGDQARKTDGLEVFDEISTDILDKLFFYLDILPS